MLQLEKCEVVIYYLSILTISLKQLLISVIFERGDSALLVSEGDNLVLSCPRSFTQEVTIYWTLNQSAFMLCDTSVQSGVKRIMKCKPAGSEEDFILKISRFSELTHIPHFHPGKPVYFFGKCIQIWCVM
ncbi:hypothetical protein P879_09309 [Paragonimus westermani]|uniref:Ig-like domain-containing protein n=1 Tax=Paragonimus westermani TaxID=34504 RepID=A0A8T0DJG6_9TREM|nr:hypothetical protein P879_09309 [Paragonimus westermani]